MDTRISFFISTFVFVSNGLFLLRFHSGGVKKFISTMVYFYCDFTMVESKLQLVITTNLKSVWNLHMLVDND